MQLCYVCLVAFLVASTDGASFVMRLNKIPGDSDSCFEPVKGLYLKRGNTAKPLGDCASYTCNVDDEGPFLIISTCGIIGAGEGCHITATDPSKRYPNCCPGISCPEFSK